MGCTVNGGDKMPLLVDKRCDSGAAVGALPGTPRATGIHALLKLKQADAETIDSKV